MPSIFGHAFLATSFAPWIKTRQKLNVVLLGIAGSIIPDADVLAFALDIPYSHVFGHRGITHSVAFAVLLALIFSLLFKAEEFGKRFKLWLYFFICIISHSVLDSFTNGGLGVALLAPFDNTRYFAPIRVIQVSPIGFNFFSKAGLQVAVSEILWIGSLGVIIWNIGYYARKKGLFN